MAKGRNQRLRFKRRRNAETDYHRRFKMLRGGNPRAVVRVSNKQVTCQLVAYEKDGDRVISTITGKTLVESYKWPKEASRKSVPACYLAGYALAKSAISRGFESAILDIGLAASSKGNRAYAALKGMVDAGLNIPHSQNILPSEERISGEHIGDEIQNAVAVSKESMESDK